MRVSRKSRLSIFFGCKQILEAVNFVPLPCLPVLVVERDSSLRPSRFCFSDAGEAGANGASRGSKSPSGSGLLSDREQQLMDLIKVSHEWLVNYFLSSFIIFHHYSSRSTHLIVSTITTD